MANVTQPAKEQLAQLEQEYPHTFGVLNLGWWGRRKFCKNIGEYKAPVFDICESMLEDEVNKTHYWENQIFDNGIYAEVGAFTCKGLTLKYTRKWGADYRVYFNFQITDYEHRVLALVVATLCHHAKRRKEEEATASSEEERARWAKVLRGEEGIT